MTYSRLFLIFLAAIYLSACGNNDDDDNCTTLNTEWTAPQEGSAWLFVTDEDGQIIEGASGNPRQTIRLSPEVCGERADVTYLLAETRTMLIDGQEEEVLVYELQTFLNAPDNLEIVTPPSDPGATRAIAVEGVTSVESLLWPEQSNTTFDGPVFLSEASSLLSFEIQVPAGRPAFLTLRANEEAPNRYIWIETVTEDDYTFVYDDLPLLEPQGPLTLPDDAGWRYIIYGLNDEGQTRLAYPFFPVQESFGEELPTAVDVPLLRVNAFRFTSSPDLSIAPISHRYDKLHPVLPSSITKLEAEANLQRAGESITATVSSERAITALTLEFLPDADDNPRLEWTVHGSPEDLSLFVWPDWPNELSSARADVLEQNKDNLLFLSAKNFDNNSSTEDYLRAQARKDRRWEAQQGLLSRIWVFE